MIKKIIDFSKEFVSDVKHVYNEMGLIHTLKIMSLLYLYYGVLPTINILLFFWIWWVGLLMLPFTYLIERNVKIKV